MRAGPFCDTRAAIGCVGRDALLRVAKEGALKQIRYPETDGETVPPCTEPWIVSAGDEVVGQITSAAWSSDFGTNAAIGMIGRDFWDEGTGLVVAAPDGARTLRVRAGSRL